LALCTGAHVPSRGGGVSHLVCENMATLLKFCEDVPEMVRDFDHIMTLAIGRWQDRNGCNGATHLLEQDAQISIKVGIMATLSSGPPLRGGAGTPPLARLTGKPTRKTMQSNMEVLNTSGQFSRLLQLESAGSAKQSREQEHVGDFTIPEYVLAESPILLEMYRASCGSRTLGPIERHARLFEAVVALCKLRWLVRLHYALVSFAGQQCSLHRILVGALVDMCSPTRFQHHSTLMLFELAVQTLHHRFQAAWPMFVQYVGSIDPAKFEPGTRPGTARQPMMSERMPSQTPFYTPRGKAARKEYSLDDVSVWRVADEMFLVSCMQDDAVGMPTEGLMQELDFFGMQRPLVVMKFDALSEWQLAKHAAGRHQLNFPAQREAHHFAALIGMAALLSQCAMSKLAMLEMANLIVAHPRTFNSGIRMRITHALKGSGCMKHTPFVDEPESIHMNTAQLVTHLSYGATPLDGGSFEPGVVISMKLGTPRAATSWLATREPPVLRWTTGSQRVPWPKSSCKLAPLPLEVKRSSQANAKRMTSLLEVGARPRATSSQLSVPFGNN